YHQWLIEFGVPPVNLFAQNINLRVLAAEAEHGRPGHIGMMNVARNQSTQVVRVFPSASTAAFMHQNPDAVHVGEELAGRRALLRLCVCCGDLRLLALAIEPGQLGYLAPICWRSGEAELLLKCLLQV